MSDVTKPAGIYFSSLTHRGDFQWKMNRERGGTILLDVLLFVTCELRSLLAGTQLFAVSFIVEFLINSCAQVSEKECPQAGSPANEEFVL